MLVCGCHEGVPWRVSGVHMERDFVVPEPVLDSKERQLLESLTARYEKLLQPPRAVNAIKHVGGTVAKTLPRKARQAVSNISSQVTDSGKQVVQQVSEMEIIRQAMEIVVERFSDLQKFAAERTISSSRIIARVSRIEQLNELQSLDDFCLLRSYDLASLVRSYTGKNTLAAVVEGGGLGFFGFAAIPVNLVLSNFLYFRAVQTIAMFYGYDVQLNDAELAIAGSVFSMACTPGKRSGGNELNDEILKIITYAQLAAAQQAAKKGWAAMIEKGALPLLLAQLRATANKAAQNALEKAGTKSLEYGIFKTAFEQIGKKLTLKTIQKGVPLVGAGLGAVLDGGQMRKICEFADIFYHKRFILEKEPRIKTLTSPHTL